MNEQAKLIALETRETETRDARRMLHNMIIARQHNIRVSQIVRDDIKAVLRYNVATPRRVY